MPLNESPKKKPLRKAGKIRGKTLGEGTGIGLAREAREAGMVAGEKNRDASSGEASYSLSTTTRPSSDTACTAGKLP